MEIRYIVVLDGEYFLEVLDKNSWQYTPSLNKATKFTTREEAQNLIKDLEIHRMVSNTKIERTLV